MGSRGSGRWFQRRAAAYLAVGSPLAVDERVRPSRHVHLVVQDRREVAAAEARVVALLQALLEEDDDAAVLLEQQRLELVLCVGRAGAAAV